MENNFGFNRVPVRVDLKPVPRGDSVPVARLQAAREEQIKSDNHACLQEWERRRAARDFSADIRERQDAALRYLAEKQMRRDSGGPIASVRRWLRRALGGY